MSRTLTVVLAVIVVAVLSVIVIGGFFTEGDVDEMGQPTAEIDPDAVVVAPTEEAPTVLEPREDVQDLAKNNDPNPLEQQVENAEANQEGLPLEEPVLSDTASPSVVEGEALPDDMDPAPDLPDAEVGPVDRALLGIEGETEVADEPVVITEETAEALEEADRGTPLTEDATEGTSIPETEALLEGVVEDDRPAQTVTDAELATDAIDAAASDDAVTEEMLEDVDPAAVPRNLEELAELLTPETFDADAILAYVRDSDLSAVEKDALTVAIQQAAEQPEFVDAAILSTRRRFDVPAPE